MKSMIKFRNTAGALATAALLLSLVACSSTATVPTSMKSSTAPKQSAKAVAAGPATTATPSVPVSTPPAAAPSNLCAGTPAGVKHIYVSIAEQRLLACTGEVLLVDTPVTTGASALTNVHNATPLGTMRISNKVRNTVLAGHDVNGPWHDAVQYWLPFSGGDGFHDASWQTFPLGSPLYKTQGSHGCVHVSLAAITKIFDWVAVGTLVTVRA